MAIVHPHTADAFPVALFTRAVNAAVAIFRVFANVRQYRRMHEMSDQQLADIGLERSDLFDAWDRRIDADPTRYLDALVRSRGGVESVVRHVA